MDAIYYGGRQLEEVTDVKLWREKFMAYNTWDTVEYTTVLLAFRLMFLPVLRQWPSPMPLSFVPQTARQAES